MHKPRPITEIVEDLAEINERAFNKMDTADYHVMGVYLHELLATVPGHDHGQCDSCQYYGMTAPDGSLDDSEQMRVNELREGDMFATPNGYRRIDAIYKTTNSITITIRQPELLSDVHYDLHPLSFVTIQQRATQEVA